jgi:adenosine deaminase
MMCSPAPATPGLRALPHGGEAAGPESVRACVEALGATRVNHGVRAVEDPDLVELLAERQVCLDVCPSSNIALSVYSSAEEHPLPRLLAAGVPVSLAGDCPLFVGATVVDEYRLALERFGLGPEELAVSACAYARTAEWAGAIDSAWVSSVTSASCCTSADDPTSSSEPSSA